MEERKKKDNRKEKLKDEGRINERKKEKNEWRFGFFVLWHINL